MNVSRAHSPRTLVVLLTAALCSAGGTSAKAQFASVVATGTRYAGNSTGSSGYNGDTGTASTTSLNLPSYVAVDAAGDLFVSDTQNNCVRRIDPAGNVSTVAGYRVSGSADTCNASLNAAPTPAQGLYAPTGLAIDKAGTLYISDSRHNCVRALASGAVDTFAANALTTVAGTCTAVDTASVTPVPNGLTTDAAGNLYISVRDSAAAIPVNQVVRHLAGASASSVCYVAGQPSANVPTACAGVTGSVSLAAPAGLAFDPFGDLYVADTGNNCVREIAGLATVQTALGQCANDGSGNASPSLQSPYGLAFTPAAALLVSQSGVSRSTVVSLSPGTGALTQVAGVPSGTPGPYSSALDGQSALSTPLNTPLGLAVDSTGTVYLADSANSVVRRLGTGQTFPAANVGRWGPRRWSPLRSTRR